MSLENRAGRKEVFYFENPLSFIKQDITKEKKFINSNLSTINELSELMEV